MEPGRPRIDDVVLSHPDLDHYNGLTELLERFAVGRVLAADSFFERQNAAVRDGERLRPGLELMVFRRGEVFRHPITNQPLGHTEQVLGTLVVTAAERGQAMLRHPRGARA